MGLPKTWRPLEKERIIILKSCFSESHTVDLKKRLCIPAFFLNLRNNGKVKGQNKPAILIAEATQDEHTGDF